MPLVEGNILPSCHKNIQVLPSPCQLYSISKSEPHRSQSLDLRKKATGKIMSAYCSCTAGMGQTCNHVAGILFRLEHANKMGLSNLPCTSLPCAWKVPTENAKYGPKQISDMVVKKSKYGKSDKSRPLVSSEKRQFQPFSETDTVQDPLQTIGKALADILPNACLYKGFKVAPVKSTAPELVNQNSENEFANTVEEGKAYCPGQENEFMGSIPKLDRNEVLAVAGLTKKQSESALWHELRRGRITASKFYAVYTKVNTMQADPSKKVNTTPLMRTLMGETGLSDDPDKCPRAIKHGRNMEPIAKKEFVLQNRNEHTSFNTEECGLFLHEEFQHLGASPDMLVSCQCCGEGVVEIKCPLVPPCDKCHPNLCCCSTNFLVMKNGKLSLKNNHTYYGQIQGQMAVTGRNYCYFFVYTPHALHQEVIEFDEKFWMCMLENLNHFYTNHMVPYMLAKDCKTSTPEPMDVDDVGPITCDVFFCPICNERVKEQENIISFKERSICCDSCNKWCHFKCVKMTRPLLKSLNIWKCPGCVNV